MKKVPLSEVKDDLSRYVELASGEDIVITRHGRPASEIIDFKDEDDWFDYRLENDRRFVRRIVEAREDVCRGHVVTSDQLREEFATVPRSRKRYAVKRAPAAKVPSKKCRSA
jgi:prevent-host-death family protein